MRLHWESHSIRESEKKALEAPVSCRNSHVCDVNIWDAIMAELASKANASTPEKIIDLGLNGESADSAGGGEGGGKKDGGAPTESTCETN